MQDNKIFSKDNFLKKLSSIRKSRKKIVFTNGCFDILHLGHINYLKKARKLGDILVVGINTDSSVKKIKGPKRPLNKLKDRAGVLSGLWCVDYIVPFSENTPKLLIEAIRPDILAKGADWAKDKIVGADFVQSYGGRVYSLKFTKGYSTSRLVEAIKKRC